MLLYINFIIVLTVLVIVMKYSKWYDETQQLSYLTLLTKVLNNVELQ